MLKRFLNTLSKSKIIEKQIFQKNPENIEKYIQNIFKKCNSNNDRDLKQKCIKDIRNLSTCIKNVDKFLNHPEIYPLIRTQFIHNESLVNMLHVTKYNCIVLYKLDLINFLNLRMKELEKLK